MKIARYAVLAALLAGCQPPEPAKYQQGQLLRTRAGHFSAQVLHVSQHSRCATTGSTGWEYEVRVAVPSLVGTGIFNSRQSAMSVEQLCEWELEP